MVGALTYWRLFLNCPIASCQKNKLVLQKDLSSLCCDVVKNVSVVMRIAFMELCLLTHLALCYIVLYGINLARIVRKKIL